ncbi:oxidoreductase [Algoriphagus namhaensis]
MATPLNTVLVGYGAVAEKMHGPLIEVCEDLALSAIVERSGERCLEKFPNVQVLKSFEEVLADSTLQLVVITTPNEFHFPMAKAALEAGKHVVVDKPVTVHSAEAEQLKRLADEKGLICSVFQNRRFDGDFMTIQEIIQKDLLGELVYLESHFDRFRPELRENWRDEDVPGNGVTYDLGTHLIDQVVLQFGAPEFIQADIRKQRTHTIADDYFDITLDYGYFKARVTAGVLVNAPTPKFLLLGKKGSYQKFGLDVQEAAFKDGIRPDDEDWGVESMDKFGTLYLEDHSRPYPTVPGDYRIFYDNVAAAIHSGVALKVKMEQAIQVLKIIEASFESSRAKRSISRAEGLW